MNAPELIVTRASQITPRRAPWPHFPHCPGCRRRLHSEARRVTPPTDDGRCPHCLTDLEEYAR